MKIFKKFVVCAVLVAMSLNAVGCSSGNNDSTISTQQGEVIATVNGENIYQSDFDALYKEYYNYFGATPDAAKYLDEQKSLLVDELINTEVLMQKAEELGITCTDEEVQKMYDEIKTQYGDELFNQMLTYSNITKEEYLQELKRQMILMDLQEEMLKESPKVTDEEVKAYYDEHQEEFKVGAGADIKHILVRVNDEKDKAEMAKVEAAVKEIESQLASGTSFDTLFDQYASEENTDSMYIAEDLGFVEFDSPYLDPAFLEGAKTLAEGEVSGPVKSSFGYHFIEVENISKEKIASFEDVKDEITSKLQEEKDFETYQGTLDKWVKAAKVKTYEDRIVIPELNVETEDAEQNSSEGTNDTSTEQAGSSSDADNATQDNTTTEK